MPKLSLLYAVRQNKPVNAIIIIQSVPKKKKTDITIIVVWNFLGKVSNKYRSNTYIENAKDGDQKDHGC